MKYIAYYSYAFFSIFTHTILLENFEMFSISCIVFFGFFIIYILQKPKNEVCLNINLN
jgi:hypothetical protein